MFFLDDCYPACGWHHPLHNLYFQLHISFNDKSNTGWWHYRIWSMYVFFNNYHSACGWHHTLIDLYFQLDVSDQETVTWRCFYASVIDVCLFKWLSLSLWFISCVARSWFSIAYVYYKYTLTSLQLKQ